MNDRKLLFCILFVFGSLAGSPVAADDSRAALKTVLKSLRAGDAKALEASLEGIIEADTLCDGPVLVGYPDLSLIHI